MSWLIQTWILFSAQYVYVTLEITSDLILNEFCFTGSVPKSCLQFWIKRIKLRFVRCLGVCWPFDLNLRGVFIVSSTFLLLNTPWLSLYHFRCFMSYLGNFRTSYLRSYTLCIKSSIIEPLCSYTVHCACCGCTDTQYSRTWPELPVNPFPMFTVFHKKFVGSFPNVAATLFLGRCQYSAH